MIKVDLIDYTGKGHPDPLYAAKLLAYTKATRLRMSPEGLELFMKMDPSELGKELKYMATSIPSSWEFADLTFSIQNVSRATAQQITRTRTASYAMQSQRVLDVSDSGWDGKGKCPIVDEYMEREIAMYKHAIDEGVSLEDARNMLPIGIHCNLIMKINFRNWVQLVRARDSLRVQNAYGEVIRQMRAKVGQVWPWTSFFLQDPKEVAFDMLKEVANELHTGGAMSTGPAGKIAKAIDLLKKG